MRFPQGAGERILFRTEEIATRIGGCNFPRAFSEMTRSVFRSSLISSTKWTHGVRAWRCLARGG